MDFENCLKELMSRHEIGNNRLAKELGVSSGLVSEWCSGVKKPAYDNLRKLADFFKVPADHLLGKTDASEIKKSPTEAGDDERAREIREIMEIVNRLPDYEQQVILDSLRGMIDALEKAREL